MTTHHLTKSAFKIARSCPSKLYYYRAKYPSLKEEDEYLKFLAEGGHIVGKLAQLIYPGGILIDSSKGLDLAVRETEDALTKDNVILFEAALKVGNKLVLVDILEKIGNDINLIEVKSVSYDGEEDKDYQRKGKRTYFINTKGAIDSYWKEYIDDIAFQYHVATLRYPAFTFHPYLLLPDLGKTSSIEGLASMFQIEETKLPNSEKKRFTVTFSGDETLLKNDHFLTLINVEKEVNLILPKVKEDAQRFEGSLSPTLIKIPPVIGRHCGDCEYRTNSEDQNGFNECWGELSKSKPHLFDLYRVTTIDNGRAFDALIKSGKSSMYDIPKDSLSGVWGERQKIQIENTKANKEWISPELKDVLTSVTYPLHFIDFETSRVAVPYHAGMRPYEQVAFQWSCHTVASPGAEPTHSEWINTEDLFPNFEFARKLKAQIGEKGTVLTWATHEATTLRDIATQMQKYGEKDPELLSWILDLTDQNKGRILDLNQVTFDYYFHPEMKGRTSLKYVLPAIWNNHPELHALPWLKKYVGHESGAILDPYKVLSKIEIAGKAEVVKEGTGAMRAYQDMMYGKARDNPEMKEQWKALLLQYCELDTVAMVVVWGYWEGVTGVKS